MKNEKSSLLILFVATIFQIGYGQTDCTQVLVGQQCNSDASCSGYILNLDESACVNCSVVDLSGKCGSTSDQASGGVCQYYKVSTSDNTVCIVDCTLLVSGSCNTDSSCSNYYKNGAGNACVDCVSLSSSNCNADAACSSFIKNYAGDACVNCLLLKDNACSTDYACGHYAPDPTDPAPPLVKGCINCFLKGSSWTSDGKNCVDCSQVASNQCTNAQVPNCSIFELNAAKTLCVNCATPVSAETCSTDSGCLTYAYSSAENMCKDCSISTYVGCTYASLPGCNRFRFDGQGTCVDCSLASSGSCSNKSQSYCSMFEYKTSLLQCIDCSVVDASNNCVNKDLVANLCLNFVYSSVYKICVDCSLVINSQCINSSVPACFNYKYKSLPSPQCLDCSVPQGASQTCPCSDYIITGTSVKSCINCSDVKDGKCLNSSNALCSDYIFNGSYICINCSNFVSGACSQDKACSNYRSDSSKCVDCSLAGAGVCTNKSVASCSTFGYDSASNKCYDCSEVSSSSCLNQSLSGCSNFRYNSKSNICVDCSLTSNSGCTNGEVDGCAGFKYENLNSVEKCFDCYGDSIVWSDDRCEICFLSANIVKVASDFTGCVSPYESTSSTTETHGSINIFSLLLVMLLCIMNL